MNVIVNGAPAHVADGSTVAVVVDEIVGDRRGVAVARNGEVVPKSRWDQTAVDEADRIEILRAAQGG